MITLKEIVDLKRTVLISLVYILSSSSKAFCFLLIFFMLEEVESSSFSPCGKGSKNQSSTNFYKPFVFKLFFLGQMKVPSIKW